MRSPAFPHFYSSCVGTGAQIVCVYMILLACYSAHMVSYHSIRPILQTATILLLTSTGYVNGYVLTYCLKAFKMTTIWTS